MNADTIYRAVINCTRARAEKFELPLSVAMTAYGIEHPLDQAHFLAQIGHETNGFLWLAELWGPTAQQRRYERDFTRPWTSKDARNSLAFTLGNSEKGDGSRYRGHGLIHTTGRTNHRIVTERLREKLMVGQCMMYVPDFEAEPKLLTDPTWAAYSAADYWERRNITPLALADDVDAVTRKVNGGINGLADRKERLLVARRVLLPA